MVESLIKELIIADLLGTMMKERKAVEMTLR
jgi:hypothetical protein